jgi:hypothetical protein
MSAESPPPPPPLLPILAVILVVDLIVLGVFSYSGALQRLSPSSQFLYGMTMFGLPVVIYILLKQRRDSGD